MSASLAGPPEVAVIGCGAVGRRVLRHLVGAGIESAVVHDPAPDVADRLGTSSGSVVAVDRATALQARVVVLAYPGDHAADARAVVEDGRACVSTADALDDVRRLLDLGGFAALHGGTLVIGAAMAPGITGILARALAAQLDTVDEIHVAVHGTGGPACARQHHSSLARSGLIWQDFAWIERPGGSSRELCWFPDPAGAHDCYRAELSDPVLLHEAFPTASRVGARLSATRRDRLTARLPMLRPPHADGGIGGVRVEVRGERGGVRRGLVAGVAERPSIVAAVMAGVTAVACSEGIVGPGRVLLGDAELPTGVLIERCRAAGIPFSEFVGASGADAG